jgi:anaerobic selenocysteine-containing dehydrogenase
LKPVSEQLLSEPVIVCRLAKAVLGDRSKVNWDKYMQHYDAIRDDIERTIKGFENYNERVRWHSGFYLPNANREGNFNTPSLRAQFNIVNFQPLNAKDDELIMMTIRSHDQFNTTIYGLNDRYRGIHNERRVVFMNKRDLDKRDLKEGDVVDLINEHDGRKRVARKFIAVEYSIPQGCAATYFPEGKRVGADHNGGRKKQYAGVKAGGDQGGEACRLVRTDDGKRLCIVTSS